MNTETLFSSQKTDYETPDDLFGYYNGIFRFDFDAAAEPHNAKLPTFITPEMDTLQQKWADFGRVAWLNPPYGRGIGAFTRKANMERWNGVTTVCLLPVRTGSAWWRETVAGEAEFITYLPGRVKFKGADNSAPFDSAVAVYMARRLK